MRHTLYFTLPDVASAETTIRDLVHAQIEIPWIQCLARRGLPLGELPEANILQRAHVMHGWGTGISFGGVLGAIVGGLMVLFPPFGTDLHIWTMPIAAVAGAVFGVWASSIAGTVVPRSRSAAFERGMAHGNILLMVDVPFTRTREILDLVQIRHPTAVIEASEPGTAISA